MVRLPSHSAVFQLQPKSASVPPSFSTVAATLNRKTRNGYVVAPQHRLLARAIDPSNTFTRTWTNATRPVDNPFNSVEVANLDNDGTRKIIAAAHTGSDGVYVYIYDYPSGVQSWQSVALASGFSAVTGLSVGDLNSDGSKEIAALVSTGDLYTWDGPTRQLPNLRQDTNGALLSNRASAAGLVLGDTSGVGHFLQWGNDTYIETFTWQLPLIVIRPDILHA